MCFRPWRAIAPQMSKPLAAETTSNEPPNDPNHAARASRSSRVKRDLITPTVRLTRENRWRGRAWGAVSAVCSSHEASHEKCFRCPRCLEGSSAKQRRSPMAGADWTHALRLLMLDCNGQRQPTRRSGSNDARHIPACRQQRIHGVPFGRWYRARKRRLSAICSIGTWRSIRCAGKYATSQATVCFS